MTSDVSIRARSGAPSYYTPAELDVFRDLLDEVYAGHCRAIPTPISPTGAFLIRTRLAVAIFRATETGIRDPARLRRSALEALA